MMKGKVVTRISDGLGNQLFQFVLGENVARLTGRRHFLDVSHFTVQRWFGRKYCRREYLLSHFLAPSRSANWSLIYVCGMFVAWSWRTFVSASMVDCILRHLGIVVLRPKNVRGWS